MGADADRQPDAQAIHNAGVATDAALTDYLHLVIGGKDLLVRSSEVREIIRPVPLTKTPMGPDHLLGLANVRGQIVCIIDAGRLAGLTTGDREMSNRTRFMILRHALVHVGVRVDEVHGLQQVNDEDIKFLDGQEQNESGVSRVEIAGQAFGLLRCAGLLRLT
jgi:chemotaxis signal transduction protein